MHIEMTSIIMMMLMGISFAACDKHRSATDAVAEVEATDSIPDAVKKTVRSIADDDAEHFAGLVSYPLQRPYPLRDINNKEEMRNYYSVLVDDSLRSVVKKARPERWQKYGWRGWSLDDGQYIWVDDSIYDVQYLSRRERAALDSLVNAEVQTLDPSMREGWRPEICLSDHDRGIVYRVDICTTKGHKGDPYRLAVYNKKSKLRGKPSKMMHGRKEMEGSAGNAIYYFMDSTGHPISIEPDAPDSASPLIYSDADTVRALTRVYWLDLIDPNADSSHASEAPTSQASSSNSH